MASVRIGLLCSCILLFLVTHTVVSAVGIQATVATGTFEPDPPVNLAVVIDDSSVDLSWSAPESNGGDTITDYVIQYQTSSEGSWTTVSDGVSVDTTTAISGLSNDTAYDFRVAAVNGIGQGNFSSEISATPGPPAQVQVRELSDTVTDTITAGIRITNEGNSAYEYQYAWCITDSDTNVCGGGDDVFNATAAKLILASEDFDTDLSATLESIGTFWFHLSVTYGSETSYASQSFVATEQDVDTSSSGGGGGGSSSETSTSADVFEADINGDNEINAVDFSIMLAYWNTTAPFANPQVDINDDGLVDAVDFSILLYRWGTSIR